jgi:hypothetical protein
VYQTGIIEVQFNALTLKVLVTVRCPDILGFDDSLMS